MPWPEQQPAAADWRRRACASRPCPRCAAPSPAASWRPGRHLVETELSDMLQISRGTLREALRQLEQEGLLSAGRAAGCRCGTWTPRKSGTSSPSAPRWNRWPRGHCAELPDRAARHRVAAQGGRPSMERSAGVNLEDRDRIRPEVPPDHVPAHRQRNPAALLGVAGGLHPDVHHVRRGGRAVEEHGRRPALTTSSTRSRPATPTGRRHRARSHGRRRKRSRGRRGLT